jgi:hypothetical protein
MMHAIQKTMTRLAQVVTEVRDNAEAWSARPKR